MISRTAFDQFREIPIESANFPITTAVPASSLVRVNPVGAKKGIIDNGRGEFFRTRIKQFVKTWGGFLCFPDSARHSVIDTPLCSKSTKPELFKYSSLQA